MSHDDDHLFTDHIKKIEITIDQKIAFLKMIKFWKNLQLNLAISLSFNCSYIKS